MQQPNEQFDIQNHYVDVHQQEHMKKLKEKLVELKEEIMQMPKGTLETHQFYHIISLIYYIQNLNSQKRFKYLLFCKLYISQQKSYQNDLYQIVQEIDPELFKNHQLPLARVKKIMKSDEDVRMIAQETPVLFAKACEIFIIELTHRAWQFTEDGKRRTLQKTDIATCIYNTEIFDFLMDIIPKDEIKSNQVPIKKPQGQDGYFSNVSQHVKLKICILQQYFLVLQMLQLFKDMTKSLQYKYLYD